MQQKVASYACKSVSLVLLINFVSIPAKLLARFDIDDESGCWNWNGPLSKGYGTVWADGRNRGAHCVLYELVVGPVPKGLELDHLCRNRRCCNPNHLEPVTHQENMHRSREHRNYTTVPRPSSWNCHGTQIDQEMP